jgi:hypothetical protein
MNSPHTENIFSTELLKHLHILTKDGKLNQDTNRKLKQILHLNQFIIPLLESFENQDYQLVDVGAGKSYLGFLLYDQFIKNIKNGHVLGIESRNELVEKSKSLAKNLNFTRMTFLAKTIEQIFENLSSVKADIVTALHACNTATDEAIKLGILKNAKYLVLIPCCQAEVASILKEYKQQFHQNPMIQLFRHAIHTREFGSHLTNVLRCLSLEAHGYQVTVTELVGLEHSMKNELIIAKKIDQKNQKSLKDLEFLIDHFNLGSIKHRFLFN